MKKYTKNTHYGKFYFHTETQVVSVLENLLIQFVLLDTEQKKQKQLNQRKVEKFISCLYFP